LDSSTVSLEKIKVFFKQFKPLSLKKGAMIIQSFEDAPEHVFFLEKGLVRMYCISPEGEQLTLHVFSPQSYFPVMISFTHGANTHYFEAMTPVVLRRAPQQRIMQLLSNQPDLLFSLTSRIFAALEGYATRIKQLVFKDSYQKTAAILGYLSEKFGEHKGNSYTLSPLFTHEHIASWAGMTRVSVSKAMGRLRKKGIIDYSGKSLVILDHLKVMQESK